MPENEVSTAAFTEAVGAVIRTARVFAAITADCIAPAGEGITLRQLRGARPHLDLTRPQQRRRGRSPGCPDLQRQQDLRYRLVQAGLLDRRDSPAEDR